VTDPSRTGARPYDTDAVAAAAMSKDPGLDRELALQLAGEAWDELQDIGALDAPEVARRLLARHPRAGATPAAQVASAAVEVCRASAVDPAAG
jgi:hypothetical protein